MRDFLNTILAFIESESLTDDEFALASVAALSEQSYTEEVYLALKGVLEARESVSQQPKRLQWAFLAKGVDLTDVPETPKSHILIGGEL